MTLLFDLKDIYVHFGSLLALDNVNLQIFQGQRVALIGSNGSGKSTLLRVLNGLISHKSNHKFETKTGSVSGTIQTHTNLRQAMLFQRPHMLRMSVQTNVTLGLWLTGTPWSKAKKRALEALAHVSLQEQASRPAKTLSQGQQQRLALARAWVCLLDSAYNNVLLLDEPTASMDPHAKREVEAMMKDFATQNMTLVFSSHNLGQVKRLATHVAYLEHGKLMVYLPVTDFFDSKCLQAVSPAAEAFLKGELV